MLKQVKIKGQSFELYSADQGRTWSSSARSLVAYERRKKTGRSKLQESFQHIGEMQDADPDDFNGNCKFPKGRQ
jgi:hypothetical protein